LLHTTHTHTHTCENLHTINDTCRFYSFCTVCACFLEQVCNEPIRNVAVTKRVTKQRLQPYILLSIAVTIAGTIELGFVVFLTTGLAGDHCAFFAAGLVLTSSVVFSTIAIIIRVLMLIHQRNLPLWKFTSVSASVALITTTSATADAALQA
jgi:hypothetical protein